MARFLMQRDDWIYIEIDGNVQRRIDKHKELDVYKNKERDRGTELVEKSLNQFQIIRLCIALFHLTTLHPSAQKESHLTQKEDQ